MQHTNDLEGMLAFNSNWTASDRDKLSRIAEVLEITDWTFHQNGNRPGYWGSNAEDQKLLWLMAGRVRLTAKGAPVTVPLLADAGIEVLLYTSEPWASHEVLLSNAGGVGTGAGRRTTKADTKANAEAAEAAIPVLRAAALENRTMSYGEFADAVGTIPRNAGAVLKLFMASGQDQR